VELCNKIIIIIMLFPTVKKLTQHRAKKKTGYVVHGGGENIMFYRVTDT